MLPLDEQFQSVTCSAFFKQRDDIFQYLICANCWTKTVNVHLMDNKDRQIKFVLRKTLIYYDKIVVETIDNKEIYRNFKLRPYGFSVQHR